MTENLKTAIDGSLFISANCELIGTEWRRIDITKTAEVLMIDINGKLKRFRASAGDNPITSWDLLNGVVVSDDSGNLPDITRITTRNHNDLQNRDAAAAHPASAISGLITGITAGSATILAFNNSVTVPHTAGSQNIKVILTPTNDFASQGAKAINYTAATFDIAFAFGATQPEDATFDYAVIPT